MRVAIRILITSIVNAFIMVCISIWLLNRPAVHNDEKLLIEKTASYKVRLFGESAKPAADGLLFINVSFDKEIIPIPMELEGMELTAEDLALFDDEEGVNALSGFSQGTQVITDRSVLARFFAILNKNPNNHRYILCDILFENPSDHDLLLKEQLKKLPNVLIPFWEDENDVLQYPLFDVTSGLATYTAVDNYFIKYQLMDDTLKTMPLVMYEALHQQQLRKKGNLFYQMNDRSVFNNFILNLRVRTDDVIKEGGTYHPNYWKFFGATLDLYSDEEILELTKGKIIVIGDFEDTTNDYHQTLAGDMPGPLILLNAYLALVAGDNIIRDGLYLILFMGFFLISIELFHPDDLLKNGYTRLTNWLQGLLKKIKTRNVLLKSLIDAADKQLKFIDSINDTVKKLPTYMGVLSIISIAAYLLLNNHINIFYLSLYILFVENVMKYEKKVRSFITHKKAASLTTEPATSTKEYA
ncbi:MAG: CHASE2 domain-containing protein [Bacteroidota bacterium]